MIIFWYVVGKMKYILKINFIFLLFFNIAIRKFKFMYMVCTGDVRYISIAQRWPRSFVTSFLYFSDYLLIIYG